MSENISGIKVIKHNTAGIDLPDDESFPFKLWARFLHPKFMNFTSVVLYGGSEEIIVRGMTKEALDTFIALNEFRTHPRLRHLTITGPNNFVEEFSRNKG